MAPETDTTYNGYTNYETWVVNLWIDNDQFSQEWWLEQAQYALESDRELSYPSQTRAQSAAYDLAEALKLWHEEESPTASNAPSVFFDLMSHALGRVNWYEIAENLIEQAQETAAL